MSSKISSSWPTDALTFDSINSVVYLGRVSGKFAKCTTASPCDGANGNVTDLTAKISGITGNTINSLTFDSTNNVVYLGSNGGNFIKCATASPCDGANGNATDLTSKISSFWSTNAVNALAYDSTNAMVYLAGAGGKFAKITAVGATQSAQSIAVDTLSTNIAYATLTKNDTVGNGTITYQLSNDGGTTWNTVTPGTRYDFTTSGSSLKLKISLVNSGATAPTVQDITIVYNGYNATGTITNLKIDATGDAQFTRIDWTASTPSGTLVKFRTRGATQAQGSSALASASWSPYYTTSGATITDNNSVPNPTYRYFETEMYLDSSATSGSQTPTVNDFTVTYAQNAPGAHRRE
ncbi:hypothetical protein HYR65_02980 [Candidatus Azambacteria bacterium]|nr:hypothetical protein [Candidatus Azambacteria bacterium]